MLKDEGRILSHGVSEGLQDFPKMECMGWDGILGMTSPQLLCSMARHLPYSALGPRGRQGNSPTATQAAVARLTSPKQQLHQVLHRPQNKEKPMQNNFEAPVWLLKMVFECSIVWCDLRMGRSIVHCQRNHPRKPKFSRNRAILPDHFSGV